MAKFGCLRNLFPGICTDFVNPPGSDSLPGWRVGRPPGPRHSGFRLVLRGRRPFPLPLPLPFPFPWLGEKLLELENSKNPCRLVRGLSILTLFSSSGVKSRGRWSSIRGPKSRAFLPASSPLRCCCRSSHELRQNPAATCKYWVSLVSEKTNEHVHCCLNFFLGHKKRQINFVFPCCRCLGDIFVMWNRPFRCPKPVEEGRGS